MDGYMKLIKHTILEIQKIDFEVLDAVNIQNYYAFRPNILIDSNKFTNSTRILYDN